MNTGRQSSPFGMRGGRLHAGMDIAVGSGTPVYAPISGTASVLYDANGYGNYVDVKNGGFSVRMAHLRQVNVRSGQSVNVGTQIGFSGGGLSDPGHGSSTGPHLHFETRVNGNPVNPRNYPQYLPPGVKK